MANSRMPTLEVATNSHVVAAPQAHLLSILFDNRQIFAGVLV